MVRRDTLLVLLAVTGAVAGRPARAQATQVDFRGAAAFASRITNRIYRAPVQPQWVAGGNQFFYRNDLAGGRREFWLVRPATKERRPLFDHARLAEALSRTLGRPLQPDRLPLGPLELVSREGRTLLRIQVEARSFEVDLERYEVRPARPPEGQLTPVARDPEGLRSRAGGP
ncbi:MAG: hypothetical protein FJX77_09390, partial [Armatimonadetes bacterium]|nr:hypothetical protein [Armatimonadota bacterium]